MPAAACIMQARLAGLLQSARARKDRPQPTPHTKRKPTHTHVERERRRAASAAAAAASAAATTATARQRRAGLKKFRMTRELAHSARRRRSFALLAQKSQCGVPPRSRKRVGAMPCAARRGAPSTRPSPSCWPPGYVIHRISRRSVATTLRPWNFEEFDLRRHTARHVDQGYTETNCCYGRDGTVST